MGIQINPKTKKIIAKRFTLKQIEEADDQSVGFCLACGAERDCCEPDARKYHCDECGMDTVYGAQEIGLMGFIKDEE